MEQTRIMAVYGDCKHFLQTFNPNMQACYAKNATRCVTGSAPTLNSTTAAYGENIALAWLLLQLYDLSEFCGCCYKITDSQAKQTARLVLLGYGHIKVTELMLFFHRFKLGNYGKFYGAVDPMVILSALKVFINEDRAGILLQKEQKLREQREALWRGKAISREEYLRRNPGGTPPAPSGINLKTIDNND